jgi:DNA (cytosine-5)-methyltransferase 1
MSKEYTFIDLFSGAGGLSCGFEKAGLTCLAGIDFLKPAIETFKKNHKNAIGIDGDIRKISIKEFKKKIKSKKIDIICGGPPCQGFSTIGPGDAKDSRNHLFLEFVRFVKELKPQIIVLENVTGLLAKKNINTFQSIFNCFEDLGYDLNARVLSSHHYGAPQIRRRVIFIGNRINVENIYPSKKYNNVGEINSKLKPPRTVSWAFKNLIKFKNKSFNHNIETAKIKSTLETSRISHVPEGGSIRYERDEKKYLPKKLWFDHDWNEIGEKRFREAKFARLDRSKPSPTIVTASRMYYHPTENRYLTTREAASLQSFPPEFEFSGSITSQWTQIGNAVPPMMAEAIGSAIKKMLKNKNKKIKKNTKTNIEFIRSTAFNYDKDVSDQEKQLKFNL